MHTSIALANPFQPLGSVVCVFVVLGAHLSTIFMIMCLLFKVDDSLFPHGLSPFLPPLAHLQTMIYILTAGPSDGLPLVFAGPVFIIFIDLLCCGYVNFRLETVGKNNLSIHSRPVSIHSAFLLYCVLCVSYSLLLRAF